MSLKKFAPLLLTLAVAAIPVAGARADNPLFTDQFSADPTARVFEGKIYLVNSHDIPGPPGFRPNWFCMEDYHIHSSSNLLDWQDHGVIIQQDKIDWVNATTYSMWAPDFVFKDGKYYLYFPAQSKPLNAAAPAPAANPATGPATAPGRGRGRGAGGGGGGGGGFRVGVAIADKPGGPYKAESTPIAGVGGIDPCVLQDKDGTAYLFTSQGRISVAKLKPNMLEIEGQPQAIANLPTQGLIEGPFAFQRNGKYYLTFPHAAVNTERLEYAMADNPMGPYKMVGVIMDESASGCWTNHHSLVEYQGQWILFYHDKDLSPETDKLRSVRADYLTFNEDGTIQKVIPTLRGVGIADAHSHIQVDCYSAVSHGGTANSYIDYNKTSLGWKIALTEKHAFVRYDRVDFGKTPVKSVKVHAQSATGGTLEVRIDNPLGPLVAKVEIPKSADWTDTTAPIPTPVQGAGQPVPAPTGVHDLILTLPEKANIEVDWVTFE